MRSIAIILLVVVAMSFAQDRVKVVEHASNQAPNIVPDSAFYRPSNDGPGQSGQGFILHPDSAYYQPSAGPGFGPQQPSYGPAFVNNARPPYPYKKYDNPYARGGK